MGRILFLSIAAYLAYRYISRSNRKVSELTAAPDPVEILPPLVPPSHQIERGGAVEVLPVRPGTRRISQAEETGLGR